MDNHYHLIIELTEENLSRAGQWLNLSYTNWFNRRHQRTGHLFQGRFKSVTVDAMEWGLSLSRYVHLNPVRMRRGLGKAEQQVIRCRCSRPPEPELLKERIRQLRRNEWGSYRAYAGLAKRPEWLTCEVILEMLGGPKEPDRQKNYRAYVEQAIREGMPESPWEQLQEQVVLGGKAFLEKLRGYVKGNPKGTARRGAVGECASDAGGCDSDGGGDKRGNVDAIPRQAWGCGQGYGFVRWAAGMRNDTAGAGLGDRTEALRGGLLRDPTI